MASLTQWTWVWVNSGYWWWTRRPGTLSFTGSQRLRHDWATELNWTVIHTHTMWYCYTKSLQLWPTLCDHIDGSPPGSPVPGILQARTLEWVAISFSNAWEWKVKVKSLSRVRLFATPRSAACQASLSITYSRSLLRLMCIESMMPSKHLILCCPLLLLPSIFPSIRIFQMSQFFTSGGQNIGMSASASVLSVNTQDWFPLGWTGWISFQSKRLSRVFSNTTGQKHQFFGAQLSF